MQNVDYKDQLEGRWNYIYFSYTKKDRPRAVGFVFFSDMENWLSRVEFNDIQHNALIDYARIRVGAKEYSYEPFNGMIYDLDMYFGTGFVGTPEQLK